MRAWIDGDAGTVSLLHSARSARRYRRAGADLTGLPVTIRHRCPWPRVRRAVLGVARSVDDVMVLLCLGRSGSRDRLQRSAAAGPATPAASVTSVEARQRRPTVRWTNTQADGGRLVAVTNSRRRRDWPLRCFPASVIERTGVMLGDRAFSHAVFDLRMGAPGRGAVPAALGLPLLDGLAGASTSAAGWHICGPGPTVRDRPVAVEFSVGYRGTAGGARRPWLASRTPSTHQRRTGGGFADGPGAPGGAGTAAVGSRTNRYWMRLPSGATTYHTPPCPWPTTSPGARRRRRCRAASPRP